VSLAAVPAQYEALRDAALGGSLPPHARWGLALLLRRGMWAWAQALAKVNTTREIRSSNTGSVQSMPEPRTVVQLFAALAMTNS
jgi:hypothetical protein